MFNGIIPVISQTSRINDKLNFNIFLSTTIDAFKADIGGIHYPSTDMQLYVQPSVNFRLNQKTQLAGSYTYQRNNPFRDNFINEHRLWQQISYIIPLSKGKIGNRLRFEERFIQNKLTASFPLSTRLRYQISYTQPLSLTSKMNGKFYFNCYNEWYFSLSGNKNAFYSENWTYSGIGYQIGKKEKIEFGYLFQVAVRNSQHDLRFLNLLQIAWITNF